MDGSSVMAVFKCTKALIAIAMKECKKDSLHLFAET